MTEHERRVNDKDIKAFENNEQKIHSYLPGQKSNEVTVQDKYLNKLSILDKKIGGDGKDFYSIASTTTRSNESIVTYFLY